MYECNFHTLPLYVCRRIRVLFSPRQPTIYAYAIEYGAYETFPPRKYGKTAIATERRAVLLFFFRLPIVTREKIKCAYNVPAVHLTGRRPQRCRKRAEQFSKISFALAEFFKTFPSDEKFHASGEARTHNPGIAHENCLISTVR